MDLDKQIWHLLFIFGNIVLYLLVFTILSESIESR